MTPEIIQAESPQSIEFARALFIEYADWLKVDLCFQGFAQELATLPGAYAPPMGRLLLAGDNDSAFGCVGLRPLERDSSETPIVGEVKRLYVQPACRHGGWGRRLVEALIAQAMAIGYRELKLDTLDWMTEARNLYARYGFRQCAQYYANPLSGVVYMSRLL